MTAVTKNFAWQAVSWLCALGLAGLLWNLARGRVPHPWEFVVVISLNVIGGVILVGYGLYRASSAPRLPGYISWLVGMFTLAAAAFFVLSVLTNNDAELAVDVNAKKPLAPVSKIRLFNFNVDHGYPALEGHEDRYAQTVSEMQRLDADVIVLQEVWQTNQHGNMAARLSKTLGFNYAYARANGSLERIGFEEGSAILSRFPILDAKRVCMKPRRPVWETRIAVVAKLDVGAEVLALVGVHLSNSDSADEQAVSLLDVVNQASADVIVGDFNSTPESNAVRVTFGQSGFSEAIPNNRSDHPWIDHIFLSPRSQQTWGIASAVWIITSQPVPGVRDAISDHDGILVDLQRR